MPTTSQQLIDLANRAEAGTVWTAGLQQELMDLIREPAQTYYGQVIPANDRTKAMDNLYRCKPNRDWILAAQTLPPDTHGVWPGAVANLGNWTYDPDLKMHGLVASRGTLKIVPTLALAIFVAMARTWAYILQQNGR